MAKYLPTARLTFWLKRQRKRRSPGGRGGLPMENSLIEKQTNKKTETVGPTILEKGVPRKKGNKETLNISIRGGLKGEKRTEPG